MSTLQLEVVTPDKTVVSAEVDMTVCPGVMGEFGVLPHHVSLLSALKTGCLRYTQNGTSTNVFISGGFADVNNKVLTVLAESAEVVQILPYLGCCHMHFLAQIIGRYPLYARLQQISKIPVVSRQSGNHCAGYFSMFQCSPTSIIQVRFFAIIFYYIK